MTFIAFYIAFSYLMMLGIVANVKGQKNIWLVLSAPVTLPIVLGSVIAKNFQ